MKYISPQKKHLLDLSHKAKKWSDTILYFRITYKNVVIKKKETQRLALYQGSPKEKKYKII